MKLADFGMTRAMFESDYYRFSRKGDSHTEWYYFNRKKGEGDEVSSYRNVCFWSDEPARAG